MTYQISKVTVVLEVWDSDLPYGDPPQYPTRRISFDVPSTDTEFYELARQRWSEFSAAMWSGGPQFNEVEQKA